MDPLTHTLTGATLARAGLQRTTPLAMATLIVAANIPDVDILVYEAGEYAGLALRRGWTHGPLGLLLLPIVLVGVILAWDRWVRRRRRPEAPPADARPLLLLAFAGALTHPLLDWLNTYGVRLLMPIDRRWFYGDALFIIDPWLWLLLAGTVAAATRPSPRTSAFWAALAIAMGALILGSGEVPVAAAVLWVAGALVFAFLHAWGGIRRGRKTAVYGGDGGGRGTEGRRSAARVARWGGAAAVAYILGMIVLSRSAESRIEATLAAADHSVREVMFQPAPATPFRGTFVAVTDAGYVRGTFDGSGATGERTQPLGEILPPLDDADRARVIADPRVRDFLVWSRFPYPVREGGEIVFIGDARYAGDPRVGGLAGVPVRGAP